MSGVVRVMRTQRQVEDEREALSALLLELYQAVDAEAPLRALAGTLGAISPSSRVAIWSSELSLCWGLEHVVESAWSRRPERLWPTLSALPPRRLSQLSPELEGVPQRWAVLPLELELPTAVIWSMTRRGEAWPALEGLAPLMCAHLARALQGIYSRQRRVEVMACLNAVQVPLFQGDEASGGLRPVNAAALELVEREPGLRLKGVELEVVDVLAGQGLQALVQGQRVGAVALHRGVSRAPLWAVAWRQEQAPGRWVAIHDAEQAWRGELPAGLYDFSPAERAVVQWTLRGYSAPEVAETLKVSPWTVRSHLKRVFVKTGTHRQSELVALLMPLMTVSGAES